MKIPNYKIYRQNGPPTIKNKPRGGVLIVVHKDIPTEDTPQPIPHNIEILTIKTKTALRLTIGHHRRTIIKPPTRSSFAHNLKQHKMPVLISTDRLDRLHKKTLPIRKTPIRNHN
ncbi:unnamed protein product [Heterotrigona itama]|uniref:Uncharacterized protein n=1 Tax=Heterotrigona itama TaxID=395501 RepID=A0A6V7HEG5_9HYME|nr:unnamed protein product [Heterotrigona itama]